jgi:protocatechuate 3,4-dioxygenase, beta subunit
MNYSIACIGLMFFCGCDSVPEEPLIKSVPQQKVGGQCEGCEAIHESPVPFAQLSWQDSLPDFSEAGPKLIVSGTVFKKDGRTPAPNVVVYAYHTNQQGIYPQKGAEEGWGRRHGYLRGWVKTNAKGEYRFYTLRPASYPNSANPAHIHFTIKEPALNEYWIDEVQFDDDPLLTPELRRPQENRGGNGIVSSVLKDGVAWVKRDIVLGKNIPGYPR